MMRKENLSQHERTARHKEANPHNEAYRKEKQRQSDSILRFHIRRHVLNELSYPQSVDTESKQFKRVYKAYMQEIEQAVEVVENI